MIYIGIGLLIACWVAVVVFTYKVRKQQQEMKDYILYKIPERKD